MADDIIPDEKNWTWVLERRCDDCGFDAPSFDATQAGMAVRDLAVRWAEVLRGTGAAVRRQSTVWSPLEYGCHVRDVFRVFDGRLQMMLEQDEPHFANWDQDKTAIDDEYHIQDPATVAVEIVNTAAELAKRFDTVDADQWQRRGHRSDGSVFTVRSLAKYLMHDPVHHLWDVGAPTPHLDAHAHRASAVEANNTTWELLEKPHDELTDDDAEEMTRRAYAAAYHWQRARGSGPANGARADWLLSRVWAVRGNGPLALRHGLRCLAACEEAGLRDFDLAYAHEALARAHACVGDVSDARRHRDLAREVPIADPEDKKLVDSDLAAEPWFGID